MSCYSTPTATEFATVTSSSVTTSFSNSVTFAKAVITTVQLCTTVDVGLFPVSSCKDVVSTVNGGGESTVQVPVEVTVSFTQIVPTATHFETTCASSASHIPSSQTTESATTSAASSTSATSQTSAAASVLSPTYSGSSTGSSSPSDAPSIPYSSVFVTTVYETSLTTLPGGSVIATAFTSTLTSTVTPTASAPTSSGRTSVADSSSNSSSNITPPIVGAIVGGIAALLILAFIFSRFLRKKRRDDDDDVMYHELVRKRDHREKGLDIDSEARPFTAGIPGPLLSTRGESSGSIPHSASVTSSLPSLPAHRTHPPSPALPPIPSPLPPLPSSHSDQDLVSGPVESHTHTSSADSTSHDSRGIRRTVMHVANRLSNASVVPPPVPSKHNSLYRHARGKSAVIVQPVWTSTLPIPVAGPSIMRMPEPPNQTDSLFVPRGLGAARPETSSGPIDKSAEAAADNVQAAEPPPPAYTE